MAEKMLAVAFEEPGGPEVLKVVERERPVPGPTEILVRVHAARRQSGGLEDPGGRCPVRPR
ncbi:hypothetical protein GCM10020000_79470 [Streptomyces olivoverticillatus]